MSHLGRADMAMPTPRPRPHRPAIESKHHRCHMRKGSPGTLTWGLVVAGMLHTARSASILSRLFKSTNVRSVSRMAAGRGTRRCARCSVERRWMLHALKPASKLHSKGIVQCTMRYDVCRRTHGRGLAQDGPVVRPWRELAHERRLPERTSTSSTSVVVEHDDLNRSWRRRGRVRTMQRDMPRLSLRWRCSRGRRRRCNRGRWRCR
eukprot:7386712-Prymnesium_polylepis.2